MENISIMVREDDFILDIRIATLPTGAPSHDQLLLPKYADPTFIVGSSSTWIAREIESAIASGNKYIPDGEYLMDQACESLDPLLCHRLSAKWMSFLHPPFR